MSLSTECAVALLSFRYPILVLICDSTPIKPRPHKSWVVFFFLRNFLHSCILIPVFFSNTYFKIMLPQVWFSHMSMCKVSEKCCDSCKCHRSLKEKPAVTKAKSLFYVGAWKNSPLPATKKKINLCTENMPRLFATKIAWSWANSLKLNLSDFISK